MEKNIIGCAPREVKNLVVYDVTPKFPYEYWFVKLGGIYSKNQMPRGKKFKRAVARYMNGEYSLEISVNNLKKHTWKRGPKTELFADELDRFHK